MNISTSNLQKLKEKEITALDFISSLHLSHIWETYPYSPWSGVASGGDLLGSGSVAGAKAGTWLYSSSWDAR